MSKRGCQSIIQCGWLKAPRKSLLWGRVDTIAMATNCDSPTDSTIDHHPSFPPISLPLQFLQTELHEGSEKSQRFHETDLEITSEDLWKSWHENQGVCVTLQTGCSCRHITWTCFPPFPSSHSPLPLSVLLSFPSPSPSSHSPPPPPHPPLPPPPILPLPHPPPPHLPPPPVFNWSTDDVLSWLETYVELPQYSEVFKKHNITGRHLPRCVGIGR